jgi:hypothetical protein
MSVLKHVGVVSVAKITALFGLLFGLIYGILIAVFAAAFVSMMPGVSGLGTAAAGGVGIVMVIVMAIVGAIGGFIYGAVIAFLYNVFAGWVGGIQVDLV